MPLFSKAKVEIYLCIFIFYFKVDVFIFNNISLIFYHIHLPCFQRILCYLNHILQLWGILLFFMLLSLLQLTPGQTLTSTVLLSFTINIQLETANNSSIIYYSSINFYFSQFKLHFVVQITVQDQPNGSKSTISTAFTTLFCTSTVQYSEYTNPIHTIMVQDLYTVQLKSNIGMVQKWYSNGTEFVHCTACIQHGNGTGMVQQYNDGTGFVHCTTCIQHLQEWYRICTVPFPC